MGFEHILNGLDHLLFLLCLVLAVPISQRKSFAPLLLLVSAFTLGHTILLLLTSSYQLIEINRPVIELLVAISIVLAACQLLFFNTKSMTSGLALVVGLIHGAAFS